MMRPFIEIGVFEKTILFLLIFSGIFLAIILLMNHSQEKRYLPYMPLDFICLLISYMGFHFMVIAMHSIYDGFIITDWRIGFINKPVILYMVIQLLTVGLEGILLWNDFKWRRNHLSYNSIKESLDSMPYGICCYYESGMPRFINMEMQRISEELFGERIYNAATFWKKVSEETLSERAGRMTEYESPTWMVNEKKVLSFAREKVCYENDFLYEILATDITEEYEKSKKLLVENERMKTVTQKLKEYSKNVTRLTIEKEVLDAKVRIHSELGQTLVATRRYFAVKDKDATVEERSLLDMWNRNITLLKREGDSNEESDYALLYANAKRLGISLTMPERLPLDEDIKEMIIAAGMECITNTYKYANTKSLAIEMIEEEKQYILRICNQGDAKNAEIQEKGGLYNLRKMVETNGGAMQIVSKPYFCLTIAMEKR